ncbi:SLAM family member 9-like isoform X1 [Alosa alosa]|nr:SLAM family member 9-like isoform X1 [Alosa alosa]
MTGRKRLIEGTEMEAKCVLLLAVILNKVASAPESVFALEGNSVTLIMKENYHLDPNDVTWTFNESLNIVRYYPHYNKSHQLRGLGLYKGRVEFDSTTFSLELKNLQKNDSGLYKGEIHYENCNIVIVYRLSIFEKVSAPVLTVEPDLSSGDLCNVTVTANCTAGELTLTSTCNSSICTQEELTMSSSLAIGIRDGDIICNHSNQLNWSHATVRLCQNTQQSFITGPLEWKLIIIAGGLALGGLFICGVLYFRMHVTNKGSLSSHIYQSVENLEKNQTDLVCAKALSPSSDVKSLSAFKSQSSSSHAEIGPSQNALWLNPVVYYQIQPHTGPNTDPSTTQPEHVYSSVP